MTLTVQCFKWRIMKIYLAWSSELTFALNFWKRFLSRFLKSLLADSFWLWVCCNRDPVELTSSPSSSSSSSSPWSSFGCLFLLKSDDRFWFSRFRGFCWLRPWNSKKMRLQKEKKSIFVSTESKRNGLNKFFQLISKNTTWIQNFNNVWRYFWWNVSVWN